MGFQGMKSRPANVNPPGGDAKFAPNHTGAEGNLPPIGQSYPGGKSGGTKPTGKPNSR